MLVIPHGVATSSRHFGTRQIGSAHRDTTNKDKRNRRKKKKKTGAQLRNQITTYPFREWQSRFPLLSWFQLFDFLVGFVVWASHSSSSLCSPAQHISTMAPAPKKVIGVCATTKIARKARPSHHKGVSFDWWREESNCMELLSFGGADGLHLALCPRGGDDAGLFAVGLRYLSGLFGCDFSGLVVVLVC